MFGNRNAHHTPHQSEPADSADDAESENIATDGGSISKPNNAVDSVSDEEPEVEECLINFLRFIVHKAQPDREEVESAEEAFIETIHDLEDEDLPVEAVVAALYNLILNIEEKQRQ